LKSNAVHQYVPLDAQQYAARFLEHWKPDLAIFTESEIWPNTILEVAARRIPLALVNARLSPRSFKRWKRGGRSTVALFNRMNVVLAQNEALARRFSELGARHVIAAGNLKIDAPPPPVDLLQLQHLKSLLAGRPLLVAASTHEGEEKVLGQAHRRIAQRIEGFCTIIAPRHPERGTAVAEELTSLGLSVVQRSTGAEPGPRTDVYIADTIGELGTFYALAPVAFIGGSLIEHGGQNPIEAVRHGAVVLTGPHWHNFRDAYRALLRHKGAVEIKTSDELADAVIALHGDAAAAEQMRAGARTALDTLSGALVRTVGALLELLPDGEGSQRAS
jgi:3-deoxy-D-manno-octulosonic-acid transferase